jgi:GTPase SAR1 family protein
MAAEAIYQASSAKILILGAGEAGKTTTCRQLHCIVRGDMNDQMKREITDALRSNVWTVARKVAKMLSPSDCKEISDGPCSQILTNLLDREELKNGEMNVALAEAIEQFWKADCVQNTLKKRSKYWLLEWADYYIGNAVRFAAPEFSPTEEDRVRARVKTTGVNEDHFAEKVPESPAWPGLEDFKETGLKIKWSIIDVGGQRSERRKWISVFDNVQTVVFLVNLLGYAEVLYEDESVLRMHESMDVCENLFGSQKCAFKDTPIHFCFNKLQSFKDSYSRDAFLKCFPECKGEIRGDWESSDEALKYIEKKFLERATAIPERLRFSICYNAIETDDCRNLLKQLQQNVMTATAPPHGEKIAESIHSSPAVSTTFLKMLKQGREMPQVNNDGHVEVPFGAAV